MRSATLLSCLFLAIIHACTLRAQTEAEMMPTNDALIDNAWTFRLALLPGSKRLKFVKAAYEKNPADVAAKAAYATALVLNEEPKSPKDEGLKLAQEAADAGNSAGSYVLGCAFFYGVGVERNEKRGLYLLSGAAKSGNLAALHQMGEVYFVESNFGPGVSASEFWHRLSAKRGNADGLFHLAQAYEKPREGKQPLSIAKAAGLYYEAAYYGSNEAFAYMKRVFKQKDAAPEMRRAACLTLLRRGSLADDSLQSSRVQQAADELEHRYPEDPVVLTALGNMYASGEFFMNDPKKALAFYDKAAVLGSDDARCERAAMQARGLGTDADPAAALAVWRELEKKGHPGALSQLGYYSYWGSLKNDGLPKDEKAAYAYSRRAAAAGDAFGQHNASQCFALGVGTQKNYMLAISYCFAAAGQGFRQQQKELPKLVTAAFD